MVRVSGKVKIPPPTVFKDHRDNPGDGGLLSNVGGVVIKIRILCILHVSCMYFACILM